MSVVTIEMPAIRDATPQDWAAIWPIFREIVAAGETYSYDRDISEARAREIWFPRPGRTIVAVDSAGAILGAGKFQPNHGGPAAHVANGSFIVDPQGSGRGVGRALVLHALDLARAEGYRAMQFNAVVETNVRAIALWQSVGFEILATVPEAFQHAVHGYVGLHIMHRRL